MLTLVVGASTAFAISQSNADRAAAAANDVDIAFIAPDGGGQSAPSFDAARAFPGMDPQRAVVAIRNSGTVPAVYDVRVKVGATSAGPALADVLVVAVRRLSDGVVVYRGALTGAGFTVADPLAADRTERYAMSIRWPDGGARDNAYQGAELSFDIAARARAATSQPDPLW